MFATVILRLDISGIGARKFKVNFEFQKKKAEIGETSESHLE